MLADPAVGAVAANATGADEEVRRVHEAPFANDVGAVTPAWSATKRALPAGWRLDGLRCQVHAPLAAPKCAAVAVSETGAEVAVRGQTPSEALSQLVAALTARKPADTAPSLPYEGDRIQEARDDDEER